MDAPRDLRCIHEISWLYPGDFEVPVRSLDIPNRGDNCLFETLGLSIKFQISDASSKGQDGIVTPRFMERIFNLALWLGNTG